MKIRTIYDGEQKKHSDEAGIAVSDDAQPTQQSDKDACDINKIIARFHKTGQIPVSSRQQFYADITSLQGANAYQESLNTVLAAQESFYALPAHIRTIFGNDPKAFVDAMDKKKFTQEMVDAGLLEIIRDAPREFQDSLDGIAKALSDLTLSTQSDSIEPKSSFELKAKKK